MERDVPYIVYESAMSRLERTIRRLWILCLVMFLSLVITNAGWIWYESQWEEVTTMTTQEVQQDADSNGFNTNTFVGGDYYGEAEDKDNANNQSP